MVMVRMLFALRMLYVSKCLLIRKTELNWNLHTIPNTKTFRRHTLTKLLRLYGCCFFVMLVCIHSSRVNQNSMQCSHTRGNIWTNEWPKMETFRNEKGKTLSFRLTMISNYKYCRFTQDYKFRGFRSFVFGNHLIRYNRKGITLHSY